MTLAPGMMRCKMMLLLGMMKYDFSTRNDEMKDDVIAGNDEI